LKRVSDDTRFFMVAHKERTRTRCLLH